MAFLVAPSHIGKLISDAAAFQTAIIDDPQLISRDPVMRQYQDELVNRSRYPLYTSTAGPMFVLDLF